MILRLEVQDQGPRLVKEGPSSRLQASCILVVEGARDLSGASFKGTDSIHENSALRT